VVKTYRCVRMAALVLVAAASGFLRAGEAPPAAKAEEEQKQIAVLKSDAPLYAKTRACHRLSVVGGTNAVPVLAALLGDEQLGDYARIGLEPIPDPSVDAAFRAALGTLKGRLLAGVVSSIGVRRDAKAVSALTKLLGEPNARGAGSQALAALGQIATDEAAEALRKALTSGPAALRAAAADACLVAARRLASGDRRDQAAELCDAVCKTAVPAHVRAAATYQAILVRGAAGVPLLIEQLRGDDAAMVAMALRAAREVPGPKATEALAAELAKVRPAVQVPLIQALASRRDASVCRSIGALAVSKEPQVRVESLKALGEIGDASALPILVKAAGGEDKEAAAARNSLRTIRGAGVDAALIKALSAAPGGLRVELIAVLADRRCAAAAPALLEQGASGDEKLAAAAFKALGVVAEPSHIPGMIKLLVAARSARAAAAAEDAVALVAGRVAEPSKRADAVLAALASAKQPAARAALLRVAGRIGGQKAYAAVHGAVSDGDAQVKDAAVRALAAWPDGAASEALLGLVKNPGNETHRVLALRGYVRLLGLATDLDPREAVRKYAEVLAITRRADSRKLVLGGLASVGHPDALKLAMNHVADPAVGAEAALAAVTIAKTVMGTHREATKAAMEKLIATTKDKPTAAEARGILAQIDEFADSITAWRIAGPYTQKGKRYDALFAIAFEPEKPKPKGVAWRLLAAGTDPERPWILDLLKAIGGHQRVAYALTWVRSEKAQPAQLQLGSDDGVKAWLNGQLVHANNAARAAKPYTDKADVALKAGWNRLLLKITQNDSPWEFCARICGRDGRKLGNIRIDAEHEEDATPDE